MQNSTIKALNQLKESLLEQNKKETYTLHYNKDNITEKEIEEFLNNIGYDIKRNKQSN